MHIKGDGRPTVAERQANAEFVAVVQLRRDARRVGMIVANVVPRPPRVERV